MSAEWTAEQVKELTVTILAEQEKARELLAKTTEKEIAHLNALRENVLTRHEYLMAHEAHGERLSRLEAWQNKAVGVLSVLAVASGLFGGIVSALIGKFLKP